MGSDLALDLTNDDQKNKTYELVFKLIVVDNYQLYLQYNRIIIYGNL